MYPVAVVTDSLVFVCFWSSRGGWGKVRRAPGKDIVRYRGELARCADLLAYQLGKDRLRKQCSPGERCVESVVWEVCQIHVTQIFITGVPGFYLVLRLHIFTTFCLP